MWNNIDRKTALEAASDDFVKELFSLRGEGMATRVIGDLMDTFLGLVAQSDINGTDLDGSICTLGFLYRFAKRFDDAQTGNIEQPKD